MSNAADAATGQTIRRRDEVVALVIDRRIGGYPDAATHAAMPGLTPPHLFEPVSLPIRARYDEYGGIVPVAGQRSVAQVLDLAAERDWKSFQAKAFGVQGKILLGDGAHGRVDPHFGRDDSHRERTLGLALYRRSTWDLAVRASRRKDRDAEVEAVLAAIATVRARVSAGDGAAMMNYDLMHLRQGNLHVAGGPPRRLPDLARALAHREGGDLMGNVAASWLTREDGPLGPGLFDRAPGPDVRGLLEDVWDLQAAEDGLCVLGKTYVPSPLVGGSENDRHAFALALTMQEAAGKATLARYEDFPESPEVDQLEAMLGRMDAVRAGIAAGIARLRAGRDGPDADADGGAPAP